MARDTVDAEPIGSRADLIGWFAAGEKPPERFRLGTEHEKVPFYTDGLRPVPYEGPRGIRALLEGMNGLLGWEPILEDGVPIGLFDVTGGGAISLEPGGQFELSGAPVATLHETCRETQCHMAQVNEVARALGIRFLNLGMSPLWTRAETPAMPKSRYRIMTAYMPKVGGKGLDMMYRTTTVQVNLDFQSEADMVRKLRVGIALQPLATALFANSPFTDGKPNGSLSYRSEIWRDTDNARAGMLPFVFEDGMGYERYVDYALDVPMYFIKRGDRYIDAAGTSFRDLLAGKHPLLPGEMATVSDWSNHLSTIFPEVRLKRYLEMRGADAGPQPFLVALSAFWVGLYYHQPSLDAAADLIRPWTAEQRQALRDAVPREGLSAAIGGRTLRQIAKEVLALSRAGLAARRRLDEHGRDEARYLDVLDVVAETGRNQAENLLDRYHGAWGGDIRHAFAECVF
jgi:glutamate--cysteine ligase